ncbi:MAG: hypothetical protein ACUVTM_03860 [Candidatus Bathyarchaeia archaeon]
MVPKSSKRRVGSIERHPKKKVSRRSLIGSRSYLSRFQKSQRKKIPGAMARASSCHAEAVAPSTPSKLSGSPPAAPWLRLLWNLRWPSRLGSILLMA